MCQGVCMQQLVAYTEKDTLSGGRPLGVVEGNVLQQAVGHCCSSAKENAAGEGIGHCHIPKKKVETKY